MSAAWTIADLEHWDTRIREQVEACGLSCYAQEFDICDHNQMLGAMAYHGMPAHYPHWSYGKSFERQKTLYDHGVSGLPYEMVINADPSIAYLMRENSLCLQILTIAHVYAHNDFFRNNFTFGHTGADRVVAAFKTRADRVRGYVEDPSIGVDRVEAVLDAAHAVSLHTRRNFGIRKLTPAEQKERALESTTPRRDPWQQIHRAAESTEPDLGRVPLEPDPDLLLFIRDYNPALEDWQRDLLTIVHDEATYFIPQMETKIMNEGWATYWHHHIMNSLELPQDLHLEFLVRHNQVVRPVPGDINPYHVGFRLWQDIRRRHDEPTAEEIAEHGEPATDGREAMFAIRECDRDISFLRRFLGPGMMRELGLYAYEPQGEELVVTRVADDSGWREVKEVLLRSVGLGGVPVIAVHDADLGGNRTLLLHHEHDGRDLQFDFAERTLGHLRTLWGRDVALDTLLEGKPRRLCSGTEGITIESPG